MADNNVFVLKSPDVEQKGRYVVLVSRGGVMGGSVTAFVVENIRLLTNNEGTPHTVELYDTDGNIEVSFTYGTQYLLTKRESVEFMTSVEAAKRNKAEEDEVNKLWEADKAEKEAAAKASPGQYI
jgi:hypothetical protein